MLVSLLIVSVGIVLVSLGIVLVSLLVLTPVVSDEGLVVDCGGLQAPIAAITINSAKKMFFIY
jgi:hypothetical protein